jgi:ACDE family multidrug resistance protein
MTFDSSTRRRRLYLDPNLQIIFAITLAAVLGVASITPAFPKIARELDVSARAIGLLVTVFTLPGVILTPLLGVLADRWGRKTVLVPALLLFGLAGGSCAFVRDFHLLLGMRFVQGVGAASLGSLNVTLIGDLFHGSERAEAMGFNSTVIGVATAGYPALGGALAMAAWYYPFALAFLGVPVALVVLFSLRNPEPRGDQHIRDYLAAVWSSVKNRRTLGLFTGSLATFVILYGSYLTYFPFLIEHSFGAPPVVIGVIFSAMSLTTAVTASRTGRLARSHQPRNLMLVAFGLYALALVMMALSPSLWGLLVPAVLYGIGQGLNLPNLLTLLSEMAPLEHRGAFMSLNGMVLRGGQTLGPLLMGAIYGIWGVEAALYAGAVLAVAMLGVVAATIR